MDKISYFLIQTSLRDLEAIVLINMLYINRLLFFPRFPVALKSTRLVRNNDNDIPRPDKKGD